MARSQSSGALKFVGAAAAAIVGGVAIGYLVGGARSPHAGEQIAQPPPRVVSTPAPSVAPSIQHPRKANGDYTAPGAPRIAIREESAPVLHRINQTSPAATADPEATQEAAPASSPDATHRTGDTGNPLRSDGGDSSSPPASPADGENNTAVPPPPDNSAPPPAPADPDFERIGKPADTESGQVGAGKAQFRVQSGSYTDESHARSVADDLRGKGYTPSTRSEREGDRLVYKVQVGAYRTKAGAGKAADDLQKKGYPAYVSPIEP